MSKSWPWIDPPRNDRDRAFGEWRVSLAGREVSHGTLRDQDLADAFASVLREKPEGHDTCNWRLLRSLEERDFEKEDNGTILEEAFDELESLAPPGYYFGAHEGDGSCFGFWPIEGEQE